MDRALAQAICGEIGKLISVVDNTIADPEQIKSAILSVHKIQDTWRQERGLLKPSQLFGIRNTAGEGVFDFIPTTLYPPGS